MLEQQGQGKERNTDRYTVVFIELLPQLKIKAQIAFCYFVLYFQLHGLSSFQVFHQTSTNLTAYLHILLFECFQYKSKITNTWGRWRSSTLQPCTLLGPVCTKLSNTVHTVHNLPAVLHFTQYLAFKVACTSYAPVNRGMSALMNQLHRFLSKILQTSQKITPTVEFF